MTTLEYWIKAYPDSWDLARGDVQLFFEVLAAYEIIAWDDVPELVKACTPKVTPELEMAEKVAAAVEKERARIALEGPPSTEAMEQVRREVGDALFEKQKGYLATAFHEALRSIWEWIRLTFGEFFKSVGEILNSIFATVWQTVKAIFERFSRATYDSVMKVITSLGVVTPEMIPDIALKLYNFAYSKGVEAHLEAFAIEVLHPYKSLGIQQIAAMVGDYAGFGQIASATIGVVQRLALAGPMAYMVNKHCRPKIPDEFMLQQMVFEGVLTEAEMKETLAYYGYSDTWIERYLPTMRPDPRYFELSMMCEDEAATDPWIQNRVFELGYEADVNPIMVKGLKKKATRTQRLDYYSKAFALYKEGYITKEYFTRVLDELEFRPEAKTFAIKAASLAYLYDVTTDQVKYWTDSYLKDLISSDELRLHLSLLGLEPERVWLHGQLARVRKYKKPAVTIKRELEPAMTKVQSTYSQGYVQLYRKGFIDEATLEADLIAIGIDPDLAEATVFLEVTRSAK